ncbi:hypothetical protein PPTG_22176 [Phytophthora nicotianae INRA-310]|uniref:Uncharacterized protein n=1 Tax=Phytophthora nicotianae (strain INRA-310) TaxID=761204 RepID=W2QQY4_PHYN3|nr:hypothetical protein PPTG_22176 [Phytophthora nicotianae INRA-310]ETN14670.1 hypothetical protein PPTG_22176 [Phytophthora nicotianae INRA-310]
MSTSIISCGVAAGLPGDNDGPRTDSGDDHGGHRGDQGGSGGARRGGSGGRDRGYSNRVGGSRGDAVVITVVAAGVMTKEEHHNNDDTWIRSQRRRWRHHHRHPAPTIPTIVESRPKTNKLEVNEFAGMEGEKVVASIEAAKQVQHR